MKQNLAQKPEAKSQEPKPSARNPKPVVRNPKTKTQNPKSVLLRFPVRSCLPEADAVLSEQGIPEGRADRRIVEALAEALDLFAGLAEPAGITADVSVDEFGRIFRGAGRNAPDNPLANIYPKARGLALFAVTVGPKPEKLVARLFEEGKFELGYLLDAVASSAADRLAEQVQNTWALSVLNPKSKIQNPKPRDVVLRYSPGYCGWDLTGQRALFRRLGPARIGIRLRRSCLMEPLKSVSGVIVLAAPEAHRFRNDFPFCSTCATKSCRARIAGLTKRGEKATKTRRARE